MSAGARDRVEVWREEDGLWRWMFRAADDHTEILSNRTFRSLEEAVGSASLAYPGVAVETWGAGGDIRPSWDARRLARYALAGVVVGAVVAGGLWVAFRRTRGRRGRRRRRR